MSKVLQERGFGSPPSSTKINPRDQVKSISTTKADSSRIRRIGSGLYAVSDSQYSNTFSEIVLFPKRLHDYYRDDWKEALEEKILETYDHTLPQKEKDPGSFTLPCFIYNVCFDKALVDLGASVSVMSFSTYSNLGLGDLAHTRLTIELVDRTIKHPRGIAENVRVRIGKFTFLIDVIILDIPEDDDVPLILGRPFLSTAHAKIDAFKRKNTLRVREEKLVFKSIKATNIIRRVYMLNERSDLDSKFELIGEAINESFDPHYGNYIKLNDLDVPLETRTDQDNNFEPTLDYVNKPKSSYKMKFSCMIRYKHVKVDFLRSLSINMITKSFYKSVIKDNEIYEGKNHAMTLIDIPIFVRNFSIISGFTIIDDVDETSGVVLSMPFCKKFVSCQKIMERFAHGDECE
ncbi:ribonuclease H-like domain-containing protein [Tanacetum coccineum]